MFHWHLLKIHLQALVLLFFQSTGTGGREGSEGGGGGVLDRRGVFGRKFITMLGIHTHIKLLIQSVYVGRLCVIPDPT